jgi:hypothetical protein
MVRRCSPYPAVQWPENISGRATQKVPASIRGTSVQIQKESGMDPVIHPA